MTPGTFIAKWRASELKERSAAQEHFIDLCRLLGEPTPAEADPTGERYCFERGARKDGGGDGWADVWKRHCFGWEYKGKHADLDAAFSQLRQYALALENPPLLIVSDMARFRIRTNWTNSVSATHEFALDDLADAATRDKLKWAMSDPERLRPGESRQALTERAAATFAELAQSLRERGDDPQAVAHFVNRLVFCMFAEDVGLLPDNMFTRMLEHARRRPETFETLARDLFGAMCEGRRVGFETVEWFNGGLFEDDATLPMDKAQIDTTPGSAHDTPASPGGSARARTSAEELLESYARTTRRAPQQQVHEIAGERQRSRRGRVVGSALRRAVRCCAPDRPYWLLSDDRGTVNTTAARVSIRTCTAARGGARRTEGAGLTSTDRSATATGRHIAGRDHRTGRAAGNESPPFRGLRTGCSTGATSSTSGATASACGSLRGHPPGVCHFRCPKVCHVRCPLTSMSELVPINMTMSTADGALSPP